MTIKKFVWATLLATTIATPALARVAIDVGVNLNPPEEQVEYVPAPPPHMVWTPGYWAWSHGRYVWVQGHYIRERPGYFWASDEWVQVNGGWHRTHGHWERQHFPDHNADWHDHGEPHGEPPHDWHRY